MRMQRRLRSNRWGAEYKDNRNWPEYNEQLVVRGEFYIDLGFVKDWKKDLIRMNKGKRGGQFKFPDSFIKWEAIWKQWLDYRGLEGVARSLARLGLIPESNDYTTIWTRVHNMIPEISLPSETDLEVGTDGSGLKSNNAGEYRVLKYGDKKKKKYLVVVITADVKNKKLLKVDAYIQKKRKSEPKVAVKHIRDLKKKGKKPTKFYGDGSFDTNDMFRELHKSNTESAIKIRKNADTSRRRGCRRRRDEIRQFRNLGYKQWAKTKSYGLRWALEGIFSSVKRKFGENTVARKRDSLVAEGIQRFWAYDTLSNYPKNRGIAVS